MKIAIRFFLSALLAVAAVAQSHAPIRVGGNVQAANLIQKVTPEYPAAMKAQRMEATVVLSVTISTEGVPSAISVQSTEVDREFTDAAMEAVKQWRYKPTLLNGEPVDVLTTVQVNFTLQR